ncbi:MAG: hypothetical protein QMC90_05495, partial [Dehalococcoidales bacterium]|nr:hypothetical protein [Dehalococcoidales bacterium]
MTPEEFIERIQKGLIKPEIRGGVVIMVDEEKGKYGFELYNLEDFPRRISIREGKAYLERGVSGRPVYFELIVGNKLDKAIPIRSMRCRVKCNF